MLSFLVLLTEPSVSSLHSDGSRRFFSPGSSCAENPGVKKSRIVKEEKVYRGH